MIIETITISGNHKLDQASLIPELNNTVDHNLDQSNLVPEIAIQERHKFAQVISAQGIGTAIVGSTNIVG